MKGFTRDCSGLLCDAEATVNYHGFWCAPCATRKFVNGKLADPALEWRLGELRHSLQEVAPQGAAIGDDPPKSFPSSGQEASTSGSLGASEPPAPLSLEDIDWILENDGIREIEWELLTEHGLLAKPFLAARLEDGTV